MKYIPIIIILTLFSSVTALAQEEEKEPRLRKKYINLSFVNQKIKSMDLSLKSNGAAFTVGRTYYLHKKPIAKMLRFGIDATWFDLTYNNYESEQVGYDLAEIGVQVGVSATINPIRKLNIHGYFRVAPSLFVMMFDGGKAPGYATYFVTGGTISYGVIGLGAEYRFSNHKDKIQEEYSTSTSGMRIYISFRF